MMDPHEIPQRINLVSGKQCLDGERCRDSPVPPPDDVASKVLDDDNLLDEILLRVGFPTTLVRATMVCRRWLQHVSDPIFLNNFRKLHPPRLLGFYVSNGLESIAPFVPVPTAQHPELAAIIRRGSFSLHTYSYTSAGIRTVDCWGGKVFVSLHEYNGGTGYTFASHKPFCAQRGLTIFPPLPSHQPLDRNIPIVSSELLFKAEGDALSYLLVDSTNDRTAVDVYMLQDGVWCILTSATTEVHGLPLTQKLLLHGNKVYMCITSDILVFHLTTLSFSRIQYPQGVGFPKTIMLSQADDDFGVYLVCANELQLAIWLYKGGNWLLVDTIGLRQMYDDSRMSFYRLAAGYQISQVRVNAEYVLLEMGPLVLYLDAKLHKAYEMMIADHSFGHYIHPFMMIWPPTLPALKQDPASDEA